VMSGALVVVESMFGNSREVADAVAQGLRTRITPVEVIDVGDAPAHPEPGLDLVVIGGPTHALGLSRPRTRSAATQRGASTRTDIGLREWLATADLGSQVPVATFDTRVGKAPGSAARSAGRRLRRAGAAVYDERSFFVRDVTGPLLPGELERATDWGRHLATRVIVPASPSKRTP
jgi:hypothetical protein